MNKVSLEEGGDAWARNLQRHVATTYLPKSKDVYWAFMDLEKAHDIIDREGLWYVLRFIGLCGR